jgi:hypothetical protein
MIQKNKISHIIFLLIITSIILFIITRYFKDSILERFVSYCDDHKDCKSCANASGCSWCPKSKVCLSSTLLKSTDNNCNQLNTIHSSFRCKSLIDDEITPKDTTFEEQYDFTLYKDKISDKIPPPNVYMSGKVVYSPADIVSNTNNVRNDVNNFQLEIPGIISSSVENQIKPMVKGILSENYYIQGFEDINKSKQCKMIKTCDICTDNKLCGWDPRKKECDKRGPDKTKYITQKQRCVLTPATLNLMKLLPN